MEMDMEMNGKPDNQVNVEPRYVAFEDAAVFFGVSKRTIRRLVDEGVVPVVRLRSRLPRIDLQAAEEILIERGL